MLLGVVDILVFLVPLRLFILVLSPMRPFMLPFCMVPFCIVPFCIRSVPVWFGVVIVPLCIVPFCMVPLVLPLCMVPAAGVVWAKAVVLKQRAQAAARKILVVFMTIRIETGGKGKVGCPLVQWLPLYGKRPRLRCLKTNYFLN